MTDAQLWALLRCPTCCAALQPVPGTPTPPALQEIAALKCLGCAREYPLVRGIPRFAGLDNYAASFGYQWNRFRRLQLDSYNGSGFSEERFRSITGWSEAQLAGKLVLDAGCGAGRFAEIVSSKYGARLVAFDLSSAVDACRENVAGTSALVCQASIYEPPFAEGSFDFVYCIGVIQHTPDPLASIRSLCRLVKPGGEIGLWIYEINWKTPLGTSGFRYLLRPLTRRLPTRWQLRVCRGLVGICYPLLKLARRMGRMGRVLMRLLPVASAHLHDVPLSEHDFRAWVLLDTFDMYAPAYDKPQRFQTVAKALQEAGFVDIRRQPHGAVSVTARRT